MLAQELQLECLGCGAVPAGRPYLNFAKTEPFYEIELDKKKIGRFSGIVLEQETPFAIETLDRR